MIQAKRTLRSCLAMVLSLCMCLSLLPVGAFAADNVDYDRNGDGKVRYVTIGDSLSNGLGLNGYYPAFEEEDFPGFEFDEAEIDKIPTLAAMNATNVLGYGQKVEGTYAEMFADYLQADVWDQLAYSGTRTEDLLEVLTQGEYKQSLGLANHGLSMTQYDDVINALNDADIVTVYLGDHDFNRSISSTLEALQKGETDYDHVGLEDIFDAYPEYEQYRDTYEQLYDLLLEYLSGQLDAQYGTYLTNVADALTAAAIVSTMAYTQCVEIMKGMNPDAQFIIFGMSNFFDGINIAIDENNALDLGGIFSILVDFVSIQRAVVAGNMDCIFVPMDIDVEVLIEDFALGNEDGKDYTVLIKTLGEIQALVGDDVMPVSAYREWVYKVHTGEWSSTWKAALTAYEQDNTALNNLDVAKVVAAVALFDNVYANLRSMAAVKDSYTSADLLEAVGMMATGIMNSMGSALMGSGELSGGARMIGHTYLRFVMGDGTLGHPSYDGHDKIYKTLKKNFEEGYTGKDFVVDYADKLLGLVKTYGPGVLTELYNYAEGEGYFAEAYAFAGDVQTLLPQWQDALAAAGTDPAALKVVVDGICGDIEDLMVKYDMEAKIDQVGEWITMAAAFLAPYVDQFVEEYGDLIWALVKEYGHEGVQMAWDYAVEMGYVDMAEDFGRAVDAQLNIWYQMLLEAQNNAQQMHEVCKQIAREFYDLMVEYDVQGKAAAVIAILKEADKYLSEYTALLADELMKLVEKYGPEVLEGIWEYVKGQEYVDGFNAFTAAVDGQLNAWHKLLQDAHGDVYAMYEACKQISEEFMAIVDEYDLDVKATAVVTILKEAGKMLAPYVDQYADELKKLVEEYGPQVLGAIFYYADQQGCFDGAKAFAAEVEAMLGRWEAMIEAAGDDAEALYQACLTIATELYDFIEKYDLVENAAAVIEIMQDVSDLMAPYADQIAEILLIHGEYALDLFLDYLLDNYPIEENYQALVDKIEELKEKYNELKENIGNMTQEQWMDAMHQLAKELYALAVEQGYIDPELMQDFIDQVNGQVDTAIKALEGALETILEKAYEAGQIAEATVQAVLARVEELKQLAHEAPEQAKQKLEELYAGATTLVYEKQGEDLYLALGGATVYGEGIGRQDKAYVEVLGERFADEENFDEAYLSVGDDALTPAGILAYLQSKEAAIGDADLITYQLDAASFLDYALDFNATPDWSIYLNDEAKAYADQLIAQAMTQLPEDLDQSIVEMVYPMVENLVYAVVAYSVDTVRAIEYINAVNPEAEIMLVGMYNPVNGLKLDVDGEIIDMAELVEYAIDAADLYYLACALIYDNVTFINLTDTETAFVENVIPVSGQMNIGQLISAVKFTYANADGHAYIADAIYEAITFVDVGIMGDVTMDGKVDIDDAIAVARYLAKYVDEGIEIAFGDVTADGVVDIDDAIALARYLAKYEDEGVVIGEKAAIR